MADQALVEVVVSFLLGLVPLAGSHILWLQVFFWLLHLPASTKVRVIVQSQVGQTITHLPIHSSMGLAVVAILLRLKRQVIPFGVAVVEVAYQLLPVAPHNTAARVAQVLRLVMAPQAFSPVVVVEPPIPAHLLAKVATAR